jgi:hypothetical protein
MTAASYTSRTFAPTSSAALRVQRALAALAVCLPVPICAASGLSLPLPATVERIAAALVPWADAVQMSANEALPAGAKGSIVQRADEHGRRASLLPAVTPGRTAVKARASVLIPRPGMFVAPTRRGTMDLGDWKPSHSTSAGDRPQPTSAAEPASASPESPEAAPAPPGPTPAATSPSEPAPPPTSGEPDPIAPVTNIVEPVVEPIVAPVVPTVEETVAPITGLLPGLG